VKNEKINTSVNKYLKYSGIAFQLFFLLGLAVLAGQYLDKKIENETPWFLLLFIILAFAGWMYKLVKDLDRDSKSDT
jgi:F0F1-type ATP synthase assembly protein I